MREDPHDNQPPEDTSSLPRTQFELDLSAYDNPEVFQDDTQPFTPRFRIVSIHLPERPTILNLEIDGHSLFVAVREAALSLMQEGGVDEQMREQFGDKNWEETRQAMIVDKGYLQAEQDMFWFFIQHLPRLTLQLYDIMIRTAIISAAKQVAERTPEEGRMEQYVREGLSKLIGNLEKQIKRNLRTRASGRPKTYVTGELPEIVRKVVVTAHEMMGDKIGPDAVPGLKGVAAKLGTNEHALGKQLVRAGHPWTGIRDYLIRESDKNST